MKEPRTPIPARKESPFAALRKVPIFLASGIVHFVLLILLSHYGVIPSFEKEPPKKHNILIDLKNPPPMKDIMEDVVDEEPKKKEPTEVPPVKPDDTKQANVEKDKPEEPQVTEAETPDKPDETPVIALGNHGPALTANRTVGGKKAAIDEYGGSPEAESAVKAALRWLQRHQDKSGKWSCTAFTDNCLPGASCGGEGKQPGIDPGLTGLSLLAFLSGGNCHNDGGEFADTIKLGIEFLLSVQEPNGRIGGESAAEMYNHALGTFALAEDYLLSKDDNLRPRLQRAVQYIIDAQQPEGGWDYTADRTGRNDSSITGFVLMALKSAYAAGIEIPWTTTYGMIQHFDRMTKDSGEVMYTDHGTGAGRLGLGMVAVGALSRQFLGWPLDSEVLEKQYSIMDRNLPKWEVLVEDANPLQANTLHNMYYWYYGTLSMFQAGGEHWRKWNNAMRDMLIEHQCKKGCARGSWDSVGKWLGKAAGRVYATAVNAMNLQVYYRYLPVYKSSSLNSIEALERASASYGDMRVRALRILGDFRNNRSQKILVESVGDEDPFVRLNAAKSLVDHNEVKKALPVLIELSRNKNSFVRSLVMDEFTKLDSLDLIPVLIERLNDEEEFIAVKAADKLRRLCRKSFNFEASAPPATKTQAIEHWRNWYLEFKAGTEKIDSSVVYGNITNIQKGFITVDIGKRDGLQAGDELAVRRDGKTVAELRVFRLLKQFAFTQIVNDGVSEEDLKKGDIVTGKLLP